MEEGIGNSEKSNTFLSSVVAVTVFFYNKKFHRPILAMLKEKTFSLILYIISSNVHTFVPSNVGTCKYIYIVSG